MRQKFQRQSILSQNLELERKRIELYEQQERVRIQVRESKDKRLKEMAKRAAAAQQQPHRVSSIFEVQQLRIQRIKRKRGETRRG